MKNSFKVFLYLVVILLMLFQVSYATNIVRLSPEYFPNSSIGRALSGADIYVGKPDLDPEIVANQKTLSVQQENGTIVAVSQPISTGAGGVPQYLGSPVTLLVEGDYSLKVLDSSGSQIYYVPSVVSQPLFPGNYYYPDYNETDQGAAGDGNSVFDILAEVGAATKATMYFAHNSGAATTTYTFSTNEIIPSNIKIEIENGAIISVDTAKTLTINGFLNVGLHEIFAGAGAISFVGDTTIAYPEWWGIDGTDDDLEIGKADTALTDGTVVLSRDISYAIDDDITITNLLVVMRGAVCDIDTAKTLTIDGSLEAGLYKVFSGAGAVGFGDGAVKEVYPQWWGGSPGASAATNNTAFQATIDAIDTMGGGKLYIPAGSYDLTTTIDISIDSAFKFLWIEGAGANTLINWAGTGGAFEMSRNGTGMNNFGEMRISNLRIDGGTKTGGRHGIVLTESVGQLGIFEKLWLRNLDYGIQSQSLVLVDHYQNLKIRDCNVGVKLENTTNSSSITNSEITKCSTYGIQVGNTVSNISIDKVILDENGTGVYTSVVLGLEISNCRFEDNTTSGIELTGTSSNFPTKQAMIINNYFTGNGSQAIEHEYARNTRIEGNYFTGNTISLNVSYNWTADAWPKQIYWGINTSDDATIVSHPEYVTSWDQERQHTVQADASLDLTGAAAKAIIIHPHRDIHIIRAIFLYTTASSADAGIELKLGIETNDDLYYIGDSEVNKAQWYSKDDVTDGKSWAARKVSAGDTLIFRSAGGKAGTGTIMCVVEYAYEY